MVAWAYHSNYMGNRNRRFVIQVDLGIKQDLISIITKAKRAGV
jgi:hypothetical protein